MKTVCEYLSLHLLATCKIQVFDSIIILILKHKFVTNYALIVGFHYVLINHDDVVSVEEKMTI